MRNLKKRIFSLLLASQLLVTALIGAFPISAFAEEKERDVIFVPGDGSGGGGYGDIISPILPDGPSSFRWVVDENGCLTVSGEGEMPALDELGITESFSSIVIEEGITSIPDYAFNEFPLTCISLPKSLEKIGKYAFYIGYIEDGLASISVADGNENYHSSGNTLIETETKTLILGCKNSVIPDDGSVEVIGNNAFAYCCGLYEIAIPSSVKKIDNYAFEYCEDLARITFSNGIEVLGEYAFADCSSLESLSIPASLTEIGDCSFRDCYGLEAISVDVNNTAYHSSENTLIETETKTLILGCKNSVIPDDGSVTEIGKWAFSYCTELSEIIIPDGVERIGRGAFYECRYAESISIPASVKEIGDDAFSGCENAREVIFAEESQLETIGDRAFCWCFSIVSIALPESLTNMYTEAFYYCLGLRSVEIPKKVSFIGEGAFKGCDNLETVTVNKENTVYHSYQNCVIETNTKTLILGCESSIIPNDGSVTSIASFAFSGALTITIPKSITEIGEDAFYYSEDLLLCVYPGSCGEQYAIEHGINYEYATFVDTESFTAEVLDPSGEALTEGYEILWYDGYRLLGKGNKLVLTKLPDKLSVSVKLNEDLAFIYKTPEETAVASGAEKVSFTLSYLEDLTVNGRVIGKNGVPVSSVYMTATQYVGEYKKETEVQVDENGYFSFEALNLPTKLYISGDGYYNRILSLTDKQLSESPELGNVEMTPIPSHKITLSAILIKTSLSEEESEQVALDSFNDLSFTLYNLTRKEEIIDFTVQYPYIIPSDGAISPYDLIEIRATDSLGQKSCEPIKVELDELCLGDGALVFTENGRISIYNSQGNKKNSVMVFDKDGVRVLYDEMSDPYASRPLPDGEYDVVLIGRTLLLNDVLDLSKLQELGLKENTDYAIKRVRVSRGKVTEITELYIPELREEELWYTEKESTLFTSNHTVYTVGSYISLRCEYKLKDADGKTDELLVIKFPESLEFSSVSVFLGNKAASFAVSDNTVTVHTDTPEGVVYVYFVPLSAEDSCEISAALSFTMDEDTVTQSLGALSLEITNASFYVNKESGNDKVIISGKALPKSTVTIFDNGIPVAQTIANSAGSYSAVIQLIEPGNNSYHYIFAKIENPLYGFEYCTPESLLHYLMSYVYVDTLTVINGKNRIVISFSDGSPSKPYAFQGDYSFSFLAKFSEGSADYLSDVYVVTCGSDGKETYIPLTYNSATDSWVGSITYPSSEKIPSKFNVIYNETPSESYYINENLHYESMTEMLREFEKFGIEPSENVGIEYETLDDGAALILTDKKNGEAPMMSIVTRILAYTESDKASLLEDGFDEMIDSTDAVFYVRKTADDLSETYEVVYPAEKICMSYSLCIDEDWYESNVPSVYSRSGEIIAEMFKTGLTAIGDVFTGGCISQYQLIENVTRMNQTIQDNRNTFFALHEILPLAVYKKCPDGDYAIPVLEQGRFILELVNLSQSYREQVEKLYSAVAAYQTTSALLTGTLSIASVLTLGTAGPAIVLKKGATKKLMMNSLAYINELAKPSVASLFCDNSVNMLGAMTSAGIDDLIYETQEAYMSKLCDLRDRIYAAAKNCPDEPEDEPEDDPYDEPKDKPKKSAAPGGGKDVPVIIDPSGYVCEAVPSNRLEGVKAEIYYYDYVDNGDGSFSSEKSDILWDASEWDQVNPLYTDSEGRYAWDVPIGLWLVKFSKDGYYDADTRNDPAADENGYLPVPPPQTDVNIALVSKAAPTVKAVYAYPDIIRIEFSQYMRLDSVSEETVTVLSDGKAVEGSILPLNAEGSFNDPSVEYASIFAFVPTAEISDSVTVTIRDAVNYAGTVMEKIFEDTVELTLLPTDLSAPESAEVVYGEESQIKVELLSKEAGAYKRLRITPLTPDIISVEDCDITADENGCAAITVKGELPGSGRILIEVVGTDISREVTVKSRLGANESVCERVDSSVESGSEVPYGAEIILTTKTEGATIYYTLNLSCPCDENNPNRILYDGPIILTEDVTIIAYAVKDGLTPSATRGFSYTVIGSICGNGDDDSAHSYDKGVITKPATEKEKGEITYTCTVCGHQKTESLPRLDEARDSGIPTYVIILIAVAVLAIASACVVIFLVIKKKNSRK